MKRVLLIINKQIYDVTGYIDKHPGEGINNHYLMNYRNQDCTSLFSNNHLTDTAYKMLERVMSKGYDEETKIYYVSPYLLEQSRIPNYFHFNPDDLYGEKYMKDKPNNFFILRRGNSDINNSVYLTYKTNYKVKHLKIEKNNNL